MEFHQFTDPQTDHQFLEAIANANWGGMELLHRHLANGTFNEHFGDSARAFYATDDGHFVGCINIVEQDYIAFPEYDSFIALLYIDPAYRGQRLTPKFVAYAESQWAKARKTTAHIVTQHHGLYEKYGYTLEQTIPDGPHHPDYLYTKELTEA
ncbi:MAG: GNAT family N-acetyltransferase [Aerococcus sp.]|nr:GNAT family N-acetyltransferase [Aerococcus sp.]